MERAVVLSSGKVLTPDLLPKSITATPLLAGSVFPENGLPLKERVGNFEKELILAALEKTDWNQKKAAQLLYVNATTLSEKLKRFKIKTR
jgi:DNA-binding NtrC family response regulator